MDIPSLAFSPAKCVACGGTIPAGTACLRAFAPKAGLKHSQCPQAELPGIGGSDPGPKSLTYHGDLYKPPNTHPYDYQNAGLRWALGRLDAGKHGLLADEPGVGKTAQALLIMHNRPAWTRVLVVCPASLRYNWRREAATWAPRRLVKLWPEEALDESDPGPTLMIAAYTQLAKMPASWRWHLLVIDEAHYCKTPEALRTQLARLAADRAQRRLLLTGTPLENRHKELWPLLRLTDPEVWDPPGLAMGRPVGAGHGAGYRAFLARYCGLRQAKRKRTNPDGSIWWQSYEDDRGSTRGAELFAKIQSSGAMLRRRKADVLKELPPKIRELIVLEPPEAARGTVEAEHAAFRATGLDYAAGLENLHKATLVFEDWARARKAVAEAKAPLVVEHVQRLLESVDKVLVFGYHRAMVSALVDAFTLDECVSVHGGTPEELRDVAVQRFQTDPATRVFVGSLGAAGVGITLTAASVVVFAEIDGKDPRQAEDRAHRVGLDHSLLVQTLVFDWSVDANLARLMHQKVQIAELALDGRKATL